MPKYWSGFATATFVLLSACSSQQSMPNSSANGSTVNDERLNSVAWSNPIVGSSLVPPPASSATKVYVGNGYNGTLTTYTENGKRTTPTIKGLVYPIGVAIGASGKIFIADYSTGNVTAYTEKGTRTKPTLTPFTSQLYPTGVAVDRTGNIFVVSSGEVSGGTDLSELTTYNASGIPILPNITLPIGTLSNAVAVDASDNIYVANYDNANNHSAVLIYNFAGTLVNTITAGLDGPVGVAVDAAGKIYVLNDGGTVTTYLANGSQTTPTITTGLSDPQGLAVDAAGNIYVTNSGNSTVTIYDANGNLTKTIKGLGLGVPAGIAVTQ